MSIQEQIKEVVTTHRVVLFMKGTKQFPQCGFSSRAVQILQAAGCNDFLAKPLSVAKLKQILNKWLKN